MERSRTQMTGFSSRVSSSRTPRSSIDEISLGASISNLTRPKTAQTNFIYLTKKPKPVVSEEIVELPVCRPTTSVRKEASVVVPASQPESRPRTAPFPINKSWTQLVRDSSFHEDKSSRQKQYQGSGTAWEDCGEQIEGEEYRIILLGRAGSGKSSTGNCILNQDLFGTNSTKCRHGVTNRFGKKICVVDTYNVFDRNVDKDVVSKELVKVVGMTSPGFHILIFVVAIGDIGSKEHHLFREFVRHFGDDVKTRTIVLFTRRDILDSEGNTIYGYVSDAPRGVQEIMEKCKRRYIAFNNKASVRERDAQVHRLLGMIENICKQNRRGHINCEVYGANELIVKKRMDDIRKNLSEELRRKKEAIETKLRMKETKCPNKSLYTYSEQKTPRKRSIKGKRLNHEMSHRENNHHMYSEHKITRLPNLHSDRKESKKKGKHIKNTTKECRTPRLKPITNTEDDEDDDFGDCDIEALKRRIEEDIEVPTLHLPEDDLIDDCEVQSHRSMDGLSGNDKEISDLRKKYEEQISEESLRDRIRQECEIEQPELFQLMLKLTRYFVHSLKNDKS